MASAICRIDVALYPFSLKSLEACMVIISFLVPCLPGRILAIWSGIFTKLTIISFFSGQLYRIRPKEKIAYFPQAIKAQIPSFLFLKFDWCYLKAYPKYPTEK